MVKSVRNTKLIAGKKKPIKAAKLKLGIKKAKFSKKAAKPAKIAKKAAKVITRKAKTLAKKPVKSGISLKLKKSAKLKTLKMTKKSPKTLKNKKGTLKAKLLKIKVKAKSAKKTAAKPVTIAAPPAPPIKREMSKELQLTLTKAEARHWLIELGGENTLDVIKNLPATPSDEELAKKLKIKVSDVRASLNKLHNSGLVAYLRDKNSETGWYSYAWVLNEARIQKWVAECEAHKESFRPQEGMEFYFCKDCGLESAMKFEAAHENSFKCPTCSTALDFLDEAKFEQFRKIKDDR